MISEMQTKVCGRAGERKGKGKWHNFIISKNKKSNSDSSNKTPHFPSLACLHIRNHYIIWLRVSLEIGSLCFSVDEKS